MILEISRKDKREILWKDKRTLESVSSIILFGLSCFIIWISLFGDYNILEKILGLFIAAYFLYYFVVQLKKRFTYITYRGIMIGNINPKNRYKLFPQRCVFCKWGEVRLLQIKYRDYNSYRGGKAFNYVALKTKTKRTHESILYDAEGFIQIIKKLNKSKLLSVESRIYK